jgi:hypothetical protein
MMPKMKLGNSKYSNIFDMASAYNTTTTTTITANNNIIIQLNSIPVRNVTE